MPLTRALFAALAPSNSPPLASTRSRRAPNEVTQMSAVERESAKADASDGNSSSSEDELTAEEQTAAAIEQMKALQASLAQLEQMVTPLMHSPLQTISHTAKPSDSDTASPSFQLAATMVRSRHCAHRDRSLPRARMRCLRSPALSPLPRFKLLTRRSRCFASAFASPVR